MAERLTRREWAKQLLSQPSLSPDRLAAYGGHLALVLSDTLTGDDVCQEGPQETWLQVTVVEWLNWVLDLADHATEKQEICNVLCSQPTCSHLLLLLLNPNLDLCLNVVYLLRSLSSSEQSEHGGVFCGHPRARECIEVLLSFTAPSALQGQAPPAPRSPRKLEALSLAMEGEDDSSVPEEERQLHRRQLAVLDLLGAFSNGQAVRIEYADLILPTVIGLSRTPDSELASLALVVLSNFALDERLCLRLINEGTADWCVPLMFSESRRIRFDVCVLLAQLFLSASPDNEVEAKMQTAGAFEAMAHFLKSASPIDFVDLYVYHEHDFIAYCEMLRSPRSTVACTAALVLASAVLCSQNTGPHLQLFCRPFVLCTVTATMTTTSTSFVYNFLHMAMSVLPDMHNHIPPFRRRRVGFCLNSTVEPNVSQPSGWTEDQVTEWVKAQRFGQYTTQFRDAWVDGDMLLKLDDQCLLDMGIAHRVHRLYVLREIQQLREAACHSPPRPRPVHSVSRQHSDFNSDAAGAIVGGHFDCFISYRRAGGSWLAQLIKVYLRLEGYEVFLDVDGLRQGDFIQALLSSLTQSTNVIVLLTENALERCSDPEDVFRREIGVAISQRKNVVPIITREFKFPDTTSLPEDIRAIKNHNAVEWSHVYQEASITRLLTCLRGPRAKDSLPAPVGGSLTTVNYNSATAHH